MTGSREAPKLRLLDSQEEVPPGAKESHLPVAAVKPVLLYVFFHNPSRLESILKKWDLTRDVLSLGDLLLPRATMADVWQAMDELQKKNPIAGFEAANTFDYLDLGLWGLLFSSAETPRELLVLQEKYFGHFVGTTGLWWRKLDDKVEIYWSQEAQNKLPSVLASYVLGASFRGFRGLVNCEKLLLEAHFPYSRPQSQEVLDYMDEYFLGAELVFDAGEAKLVFDSSFMDLKLRTFDPELRVILERKISGTARSASTSDARDLFLSRVRALIRANLASKDLSSRWIARQMRFSQRTLDRHLARQGTTYKALREQLQLESAQSLLMEQFSVKQVALKVGFADVSSFVRAFKRWAGTTPGDYQKAHTLDRAGK